MDRERVQRCLEVLAAYRASGQKAKEWAPANGVPERVLATWCAHSRRWQGRLDGVSTAPLPQAKPPNGFVAARVAPGATLGTVHVEVSSGVTRLDLHWPLARTRELAALVRELVRRSASIASGWRSVQATCAGASTNCWHQVVHDFVLGAQGNHAYVFAYRRADRLKVLVFDGVGMWLCTRRLQSGGFAWPREDSGSVALTREQLDLLVAGLPWQGLSAPPGRAITAV